MLNLRQLTRASPNDANLRTGHDPLGMLREGEYDSNRYQYYHNTHTYMGNGTDDIFNHLLSNPLSPSGKGGILPLDVPNGIQSVRNALIAPLVIPKIHALIDFQPVPQQPLVNPVPSAPLRN